MSNPLHKYGEFEVSALASEVPRTAFSNFGIGALVRSIVVVKLPPPIWALIYVLVALAVSWQLGWPELPGLPLPKLGIALAIIPWALPVWAARTFRRAGTEINPTSPTNRALVVDGPYRYTRNPMYLGLVVALGIAVGVGAWPMFLAPIAVFATANWVHIPFEEAKMRRQFGAAFDAYTARVRRWV